VEIPSSEHIIKHAYGWDLRKSIDLSIERPCGQGAGLYTVWFPIDASRAEMNWFLDIIEEISTKGHMDAARRCSIPSGEFRPTPSPT